MSADTPDDLFVQLRDAADRIEELENALGAVEADMDQITGFLAGVGTVHTEEGALAGINLLPSVQAASVRWLSPEDGTP